MIKLIFVYKILGRCRRKRIKITPRTVYPNRIAYLIATKRNKLKRMALRGSVQMDRRVKSSKLDHRTLSIQITRKGVGGKRAGRPKKVFINILSLLEILE